MYCYGQCLRLSPLIILYKHFVQNRNKKSTLHWEHNTHKMKHTNYVHTCCMFCNVHTHTARFEVSKLNIILSQGSGQKCVSKSFSTVQLFKFKSSHAHYIAPMHVSINMQDSLLDPPLADCDTGSMYINNEYRS